MPSSCCVCKNRHSTTNDLKFYRIPSGHGAFQKHRRRLWLQAIKNGCSDSEEPKGNARVCGAHFLSGQASMNHDSPDFVPSLFTCTKKSPEPKREVGRHSHPKKKRGRPRKVNVASNGGRTTPPPCDIHPQVLQSSSPVETAPSEPLEATSSSPTDAMGVETPTQEQNETPNKTENPQTSSSTSQEMKNNHHNCEEPEGNAHFISGQASMNHDIPDFVPSLSNCTNKSPDLERRSHPKKKRGRPRKVNVASDGERTTPPPSAIQPQVLQSSSPVETAPSEPLEATSSSPTDAMEGETVTQEQNESPTKTENPQTSSPSKESPSVESEDSRKLDKGHPFVSLRSVISSFGWYQCEVCSCNYPSVAKFIKHQERHGKTKRFCCEMCKMRFQSSSSLAQHRCSHKVERPFPCNICDKSFSTQYELKRHKLLHVPDRRKCRICGTLFCRRHNHVFFQTQAASVQESEPEESEPGESEPESEPESQPDTEPEPSAYNAVSNKQIDARQSAEVADSNESATLAPTAQTVSPAPPHHMANKDALTASHPNIMLLLPIDLPPQPSVTPRLPPLRPIRPRPPQTPPGQTSTETKPKSSLNLFSPKFLTSAFLKVKRNYEYDIEAPSYVKERGPPPKVEPLPQPAQDETSSNDIQYRRIAYDIEIVI
ncbi:uncharacterized protein LOC143012802 [Genypterus blacodes]|uniref:uncharacterized protein LOC143012802 n=1 Tax=Genypterus blacodes TaxID=154954 RepID=UPI003F76D205